jgi:N-dimethylarginine dimethylaminohydrolase
MRKLLLCPPEHYGIEYEINPWMDRTRQVAPALARSQWRTLQDTLQRLGCHISLLAPQPKLPDMVFTANAGLLAGRKFIRSNFRFRERQGEEAHFEKWFRDHEYEVVPLPAGLFFEGEGDALFCGEVLFCGYRFRSDIRSHQFIGDILKCLVVSVEMVEDRFYHLDTCFCPLPNRDAIWYPRAFDTYAQRAIRAHTRQLIEVAPDEAVYFACNAIVLGREIVLPEACPKLCADLVERGYHPHALPMTEFLKAGGACKCLTLFLPQQEPAVHPRSAEYMREREKQFPISNLDRKVNVVEQPLFPVQVSPRAGRAAGHSASECGGDSVAG